MDQAKSSSDVERVDLRDANAHLVVANSDSVDDADPANGDAYVDVDVVDCNADVAIFDDGLADGGIDLADADADTDSEHPNANSNRLTLRNGTLANPIRYSDRYSPYRHP